MSIPASETPPAAAQEPAETPTDAPDADAAPAQETDWKSEARKWESLAKKNLEAANRLAEIEEASKTEAQKAADRLAAAEEKVKQYETRAQIASWKDEVATATGVPAKALAGSTREEIEAHAEVLKSLIKADDSGSGPYVPNEGTRPTGGVKSTAQKFADAVSGVL